MTILEILTRVQSGALTPEQAAARLDPCARTELEFAQLDVGRLARRGIPEAVYGPGKRVDQIVTICRAMNEAGQNAMVTRVPADKARAIGDLLPNAVYHEAARLLTLDCIPLPQPDGLVAVVSGGTTDIPVAEEAAITAERMGARVERRYDIGVAGIHRLFRHMDRLRSARAVIAVAGMEGALPSVIGGLIDRPLIAVPTSIGYGTGAGGYTALFAMLTSCAPGVTVVNIDNGYGAGIAAAMINRNPATGNQSPRNP